MLTFRVDFNDISGDDEVWTDVDDLRAGWFGKMIPGAEAILTDNAGHSCRAVLLDVDSTGEILTRMDWSTWRSIREMGPTGRYVTPGYVGLVAALREPA